MEDPAARNCPRQADGAQILADGTLTRILRAEPAPGPRARSLRLPSARPFWWTDRLAGRGSGAVRRGNAAGMRARGAAPPVPPSTFRSPPWGGLLTATNDTGVPKVKVRRRNAAGILPVTRSETPR